MIDCRCYGLWIALLNTAFVIVLWLLLRNKGGKP